MPILCTTEPGFGNIPDAVVPPPIRVAVLGLGIMGRRMLAGADRHPGFEPASGFDRDPEARARAAREHPSMRAAGSAREAIERADVVHVATPPATHPEYVRLALAAGKAVFCEKPLAVDLPDARRLVEEARAAGVPHAVNFPFASGAAVSTLERILDSGELGDLRRLEIRFHFPRWPRAWQEAASGWLARRAQGGFTREVFSHFAYLTFRLLGPELRILSHRATYPPGDGSETELAARMETGAGLPVLLTGAVGGAAPDANEWTLYGSKRALRLKDWRRLLQAEEESDWTEVAPDREGLPHLGDQLNALAALLRGDRAALPGLEVGLRVQELVEALLAPGA